MHHRRTTAIRLMRARRTPVRTALIAAATSLVLTATMLVVAPDAQAAVPFPIESLNGSGNNAANPTWGQAGTNYRQVGPVRYANGVGTPVAGPNSRYISNRVFNDLNQNVFSDHRVTQWGWTWGQFLDHTFGLAQGGTESANIPFNSNDPLESFTDDLGVIPFTRDAVAAGTGTGTGNPRQQVNTENSYIDAEAVYGTDAARQDWLRAGPVDGNPTNNSATLLLPDGYLPRRDARGNPSTAPSMAADGRLLADPNSGRVAGDVRANENIALTATQTLMAREHNRIVSLLPNSLSQEDKFQIARRVVIAEQQYITYNEFLPAMGVSLPRYTGYQPTVNATLSNEFAVVGYRAHSQIHGEFEFETDASRYSQADLDSFEAQGLEVAVDGGAATIAAPLNVAFFNPNLLQSLQIGPLLSSLTESQYKNDEQFDNQLRSVLFQIPVPGNPECVQGPDVSPCFNGVVDLAAIDVERARDHGIGTYNQLRQAYGLPPRTSFTQITGEATDQFPAGTGVDNPNSIDITGLTDLEGQPVAIGDDGATNEVRRTTVAARLRAIYGNVNNVDAFVGMVAEPHLYGSEFGELQNAIWTRQFQALRDGDRFFYGNDQGLSTILSTYGIDFHTTLAQVIARNTDTPPADMNPDVFLTEDEDLPAPACRITYAVSSRSPGTFHTNLTITNLSATAINGWNLRWRFPNGQTISQLSGATGTLNAGVESLTNVASDANIPPGGTINTVGFDGAWDNAANPAPANFTLNNRRCAMGTATNLSAARATTASSFTQTLFGSNAVDGNTDSYWESANNAFPQSLAVDLGTSRPLSAVLLSLPPSWATRSETLSIQGSANGTAYTTLVNSASYTFNPATGNQVTIDLPSGATSRFIRVNITANSGWPGAQISELAVMGAPRLDLAMNRPTGASGFTQTYVPANATDTNTGSYWEGAPGFPAAVTVDLGSLQAVGSVVIGLPPSTAWPARNQTLSVQGSTNGTTFTTIAGPTSYTFNPNTGNTATVSFASTGTRYIRLNITANNGAPSGQVSALTVYSP
jgi:hypothetical protein